MTIERLLRGIAGAVLLLSLILAVVHSQYWLIFTAFVALNLLQSAFTNWCPMILFLEKLGFKREKIEEACYCPENLVAGAAS